MLNTLQEFIRMGGYGNYIWSAYGIVVLFLIYAWRMPWQRWRKMRKEKSERT